MVFQMDCDSDVKYFVSIYFVSIKIFEDVMSIVFLIYQKV